MWHTSKGACESNCTGRSLICVPHCVSNKFTSLIYKEHLALLRRNLTHWSPKRGLSLLLNHLEVKSIQFSWDPECVRFLVKGKVRPRRCSALETDVWVWAINQLVPKVTPEGARFFRLGNQPEQDMILAFSSPFLVWIANLSSSFTKHISGLLRFMEVLGSLEATK